MNKIQFVSWRCLPWPTQAQVLEHIFNGLFRTGCQSSRTVLQTWAGKSEMTTRIRSMSWSPYIRITHIYMSFCGFRRVHNNLAKQSQMLWVDWEFRVNVASIRNNRWSWALVSDVESEVRAAPSVIWPVWWHGVDQLHYSQHIYSHYCQRCQLISSWKFVLNALLHSWMQHMVELLKTLSSSNHSDRFWKVFFTMNSTKSNCKFWLTCIKYRVAPPPSAT